MKALHKLALLAGIAGAAIALVRQTLRRSPTHPESSVDEEGWEDMPAASIPTVSPVQDADPLAPEPLQSQDQRIAQNAPL